MIKKNKTRKKKYYNKKKKYFNKKQKAAGWQDWLNQEEQERKEKVEKAEKAAKEAEKAARRRLVQKNTNNCVGWGCSFIPKFFGKSKKNPPSTPPPEHPNRTSNNIMRGLLDEDEDVREELVPKNKPALPAQLP